jgi:hypothetical protein
VIEIPSALLADNGGRGEKLTRTLAYHLTPYELTLAVDLDTFNCFDLVPLLEHVYGQPRSFVMAAAGHDQNESNWHPDHGVKLMWWSEDTRRLLFAWEDAQRELGLARSDQQALMRAVQAQPSAPFFRFGRLPRALSCRVRPARGESFAMEWETRRYSMSIPWSGPLYIFHFGGGEEFSEPLCALANAPPIDVARSITFRHDPVHFPSATTWRDFFAVVRSDEECVAVMGEGHCLEGLRWEERKPDISVVLQSEYLY